MKPNIVVFSVAIVSGIGSVVGAAILGPALPPIAASRPLPVIDKIALAGVTPSPSIRPVSIEQRVRAEALIRTQA